MTQNRDPPDRLEGGGLAKVFVFVLLTHIKGVEWIFRRPGTRGKRADGLAGPAFFLYTPLFFAEAIRSNPRMVAKQPHAFSLMAAFMTTCILLMVWHRVATSVNLRCGARIHTRCIGRSRLQVWRISGETARKLEFLFCWTTGGITFALSQPLGAHLMLSGVVLVIQGGVMAARDSAIREASLDAEIENEYVARLRRR